MRNRTMCNVHVQLYVQALGPIHPIKNAPCKLPCYFCFRSGAFGGGLPTGFYLEDPGTHAVPAVLF